MGVNYNQIIPNHSRVFTFRVFFYGFEWRANEQTFQHGSGLLFVTDFDVIENQLIYTIPVAFFFVIVKYLIEPTI